MALPTRSLVLSIAPRALTSVRSRLAMALLRLSPISWRGILSTFLMMFSTVASVASSWPGVVGSRTGFCDQSTVAWGAAGKKSSDT